MSAAPRVVLDTNVALSALLFAHGRPAALRRAWQQARCRPLMSAATAAELLRALAYPKFRLSRDEQQRLLADYLPYCTTVRLPARSPKVPECRDPLDRPFLELALAGRAKYLVSGDKDLLSLAGSFACPIVTPASFLEAISLG